MKHYMRLLPLALLVSAAVATAADAVRIHPEIPEGADRVTVELTVNRPQHSTSGGEQRQLQSQPLPEGDYREYGNKRFDIFLDLGTMADGFKYFAMGRSAEEIKLLQRDSNELLQVVILRESEPGKKGMEKVTDGFILSGGSVAVPLKFEFPPIGKNGVREANANLQFSMNRSGREWSGHVWNSIQLQAEGSRSLGSSRLVVAMAPLVSTSPTLTQQVTIRVEPFSESLPVRTAAGKLDDALSLGQNKIMIESIAADFSSVTLAVVNGTWADLEKQQVQNVENLPKFAQVELLERKIYTTPDLLALSKSGHTVLVFGEFRQEMPPGYSMPMGGRGGSPNLMMSEDSIVELLGREMEQPPTVAFAVRQVSAKMLYDDYIMRKPGFLTLSDYDDPLRVTIRSASPHYYGDHSGGQPSSSLRDRLGLPSGRVSLVLADQNGKVLAVKPDAGADLRGALLEINEIMHGGAAARPADAATTATGEGTH